MSRVSLRPWRAWRETCVAVLHKAGALLHRARFERDLDEEMAFHRAMLAERGDPHRKFGNEVRLREATREAWMFSWLESLSQDLRYALRGLRHAPGFALGVVATLALGIGANSAIFSLAYGVLWKPLPYPDPGRIIAVRQAKGAMRNMMNSGLDIVEARGQNTGFSAWAMYRGDEATLTGAGDPAMLSGAEIEAGVLQILGAKPVLGRLFDAGDDHANAPPVILISAPLWRQRWGGRRDTIGQTAVLQGKPYTIVGVLPSSFQFPDIGDPESNANAYWRPWRETPEGAGERDVAAIARLASGVTLAQAQARLALQMHRLAAEYSQDAGWSFVLTPLRGHLVADSAPALWMMLAVVGLVLLIAAANVACLLLARTQRRERELATRAALGASRGRILRQLGTETALLLAAGAGAGLGLAALGIAWLRAAAPTDLPRLDQVGMNWPVVGFTAAIALFVGLVFGLAPALAGSGGRVDVRLRQGAPSGVRRDRGRAAWVVTQVALSLLLLVGAGLLLKAFQRIMAVPLGFNPDHTLTFWLSLPQTRYPDLAARRRFYATAAERLAALPGVQSVGAGSAPLGGSITTGYSLPGRPLKPNDDSQEIGFAQVDAGYFPTLQIPVLAGRGLLTSDSTTAPPVAVINQTAARALFAGKNPVGQRIRLSYGQEPWRTIVGVVGKVQNHFGDKPAAVPAYAYVPIAQSFVWDEMEFLLRTPGNPMALAPSVHHAVLNLDSQMPVIEVKTMDAIYANAVAQPRFRGYLVTGFALLALVLAAVGIYGVFSYTVGGRTQEFGIRAALGARPGQVLALILRQALGLLALGLGLGLAAALLLTRYLAGLLYGVSPTDPWVLASTILLLVAVGLAAAWPPGRRAMSVDPARALRAE